MKVYVINQKIAFVRHWGKWYRVLRAGEDWRKLDIGKKYIKPFSLKTANVSLAKKYGKATLPKEVEELELKKRAV